MASLDDAYNQLKIANQHLTAIDNDLQTVNASVKVVGADEQATTAAVQTGFSELYSLVNYTDQLLQYEIAQNNTIICYLGKIAQQTCALLNEAALQTAAQQAMRDGHPRSQAALRAGQPGRSGRATPPRRAKGTGREVLSTTGAGAAMQVPEVRRARPAPERRR